jgi:hypothetical protein
MRQPLFIEAAGRGISCFISSVLADCRQAIFLTSKKARPLAVTFEVTDKAGL